MKFPLPPDTFPRVHLSQDDRAAIERLAQVVVDDTLQQYHEHLHSRRGELDTNRWKLVKARDSVRVYKERRRKDLPAIIESTVMGGGRAAEMPGVLTIGTMEGELEDVIYGIENHTLDMMRIKSVYTGDGMVDCANIATVLEPTRADPLRALTIKWLVKGRPLLSRPFVRFRDSLYLESTGITLTSTGERIGYQLHHSVEIPEIHELTELGIIRAKISLCCLYRQREPNVVELYMKGFLDPLGDIHASVAIASLAESTISVGRNVHCGQMKKLTWMLSNMPPSVMDAQPASSNCTVCGKPSLPLRYRSCRLCSGRVCSSCRVRKQLCLISAETGDVVKRSISLCSRCVHSVATMSALSVATHEVESENQFAAYDAASDWVISPSSTASFSSSSAASSTDSAEQLFLDSYLDVLSMDSVRSSTISTTSFRSEGSAGHTLKRKTKPSWRC